MKKEPKPPWVNLSNRSGNKRRKERIERRSLGNETLEISSASEGGVWLEG